MQWFPTCPTWSYLRGLGRSPISRMTILIPVIGTLILFSSAVNEFISLSADFLNIEPEKALTISRRNSFFLYFGLLMFSASTFAYNALCPSVVKEFPTEYDLYDAELRLITKDRACSMQEGLNSRFQANLQHDFELSDDGTEISRAKNFERRNSDENREYWLKAKSAPVSDLLQKYYRLEDESRPAFRRVISVAYAISVLLICVPPATMLLEVVLQAF